MQPNGEGVAIGQYLNDDGLVLDVKDNQNIYTLSYTHTNTTASEVPALLTLTVASTDAATNFESSKVNENDVLSSIYINNAKALNLDKNSFSVKVTNKDKSTSTLDNATYDTVFDRLALEGAAIMLPTVATIEFTKV